MTEKKFNEFILVNKVLRIEPHDIDGFDIYFENGEYISVGSGYDGMLYTHCSELKLDTKQLIKDLSDAQPNFIENMIKKYGKS